MSPGCQNCYAIRQAHRLAGNPNPKIAARYKDLTQITNGVPNWTGETFLDEDVLLAPLRRKKPTTYFISLSDLFYAERPDSDIDRVFAVMALARWHTFQVLTKYAERTEEWFLARPKSFSEGNIQRTLPGYLCRPLLRGLYGTHLQNLSWTDGAWPLPNLWLGVSVENREQLKRVDALRCTPAAVRFLSLEPLLEDLGILDLTGIDWVICGGESGPGARPCNIEWIRSIVRQCAVANVPCFVKQVGALAFDGHSLHKQIHHHSTDGNLYLHLADRKGGDPEEWPEDIRCRQYPEVPHA